MENIGVGLMLMVVGSGDRLCHSPHRYLSKQVPYYCCQQSGPRRDPQKSTCCSTYGRYWCYGCY